MGRLHRMYTIRCCDQYLLNVCTIKDHYISLPLPLLVYILISLYTYCIPSFFLLFGECWCQQNRVEIDGFRIPAVPFYYIYNMYLIQSSERNESITKRDAHIKNKCLSFHFFFFLFKDLILRLFNLFQIFVWIISSLFLNYDGQKSY